MRIDLWPLAIAAVLSGCSTSHPGFGADDITRVDKGGVPTYSAFGKLQDWETPEKKVAQMMTTACPNGHPVLLSGQAMDFKGVDINRADTHGKFWIAVFSCDQPI